MNTQSESGWTRDWEQGSPVIGAKKYMADVISESFEILAHSEEDAEAKYNAWYSNTNCIDCDITITKCGCVTDQSEVTHTIEEL